MRTSMVIASFWNVVGLVKDCSFGYAAMADISEGFPQEIITVSFGSKDKLKGDKHVVVSFFGEIGNHINSSFEKTLKPQTIKDGVIVADGYILFFKCHQPRETNLLVRRFVDELNRHIK